MSLIEPSNIFKPQGRLAGIPAWWRTFVFRVLNGRQLSVYLYLLTLMEDGVHCSPTTRQIASDVGLLGATMVFDAIKVLEEDGFILRSRNAGAGSAARRNIYQRPSCEFTILHLLRTKRIDAGAVPDEAARELLEDRYERYAASPAAERTATLIALLQQTLQQTSLDGKASSA